MNTHRKFTICGVLYLWIYSIAVGLSFVDILILYRSAIRCTVETDFPTATFRMYTLIKLMQKISFSLIFQILVSKKTSFNFDIVDGCMCYRNRLINAL